MKPIIGIVSRPLISESGNHIFYVNNEIKNKIVQHGAIAISIIPSDKVMYDPSKQDLTFYDETDSKKIIDMCSGLIFQGGDEFYGYDMQFIKYAYDKNIPTLGICLGMQIMGYFLNGKYEKIKGHFHKQKLCYVHDVILNKSSKLHEILKTDKFKVNSSHDYMITKTDLFISGKSNDNVIEAVEDSSKRFFIGLQWHPERLDDEYSSKLFKYFIKECS